MQQICRTCLATCGELVPIFCNDYYIHNLPTKLLHTISIKVHEDDSLPKLMCKKCIFLVDTLYCFKDQCEMAEIKLRKNLENSHSEDNARPAIDYGNSDERLIIQNKDENVSDCTTSSEEDYHIEYISEEARLEVENARRRSRRAKRRRKRTSKIGVKLLESIPSLSKKIRPLNFPEPSSDRQQVTRMADEDTNLSESDDRSSLLVGNGSKIYISRSLGKKRLKRSNTTLERLSFSETKTTHYAGGLANTVRAGSKRIRDLDFPFGQLSKVPRKVMFEEDSYNDGTTQMIEMDENQENIENQLKRMEKNTYMQINIIEDGTNETSHCEESTEKGSEKKRVNFDLKSKAGKTANSDTTTSGKTKFQNLVESIVLNMPDICAICSQQFRSYSDVLKHKICTHMNPDQEYYFCPVCHDKFYSSSDLTVHLDGHANIQSFVCTICSTNFYTDETLRKHLFTHVDLDILKCKICFSQYREVIDLVEHMKGHIPEKHLTCILCNIGCKNKEELQYHVIDQHKISKLHSIAKKPRGIEDPGSNGVSENVSDRTREPPNFACPYCQLRFTTQESLRDHVYRDHTHVGVQPSCDVSQGSLNTSNYGKSPKQQRDAKADTQQRSKNDGKKFRCRICHEILVSRNAYSEHVKVSHPSSEVLREFVDPTNEKKNDQSNYHNCTT